MCMCCKCGKEGLSRDFYEQWTTTNDWTLFICKDCIEKYKMYGTEVYYSKEGDMTFIFAAARVYLGERPLCDDYIFLSQTLIGYVYGTPEANKDYIDDCLSRWISNRGNDRTEMLRQSFNDNHKFNEEVLY